MIKVAKYIAVVLVALSLTQCKKETPGTYVEYTEDAVFFVNGTLDGQAFDHQAGNNNYTMSSEYKFRDSIVEMRGSLMPSAAKKKSGFEIRLRGKQRMASVSSFDPAQNLSTGVLSLRDATGFKIETGKYIVSLSCDTSQGQYASHLWIFPDGTYSNAYYVNKKVSITEYPSYPIRLVTSGNFSCQAEVYHEINILGSCDAGFDINMLGPLAQLSLKNVSGTIDHVQWYVNDTVVTPSATNNAIYLGNTGEDHRIGCRVFFTDGCVKIMERVISANFASNCMTDFQYSTRKEVIFDPSQLSTAEIIYFDEDGKRYSSYYPDAFGEFEVMAFTPYKVNAAGDPTFLVEFEANAILKSSDGSSLDLSEIKGTFALAHP